VRFSLMTEPQIGGTYDQILAAARWAEAEGIVSFARSDHYYSSRDPRPDATDAFATLAGLARETSTIRLCVLVSPITFRHPAVIAKSAATIDQMAGGRLDLGVGTGWMELEHEAYGIDFPEQSERFERMEEATRYLRAAFSEDHAEYTGKHYRLDAQVRPRPTDTRIVIGGSGKLRTPTLAGTVADEYNLFVSPPDQIAARVAVCQAAAEAAGRSPDSVEVTVMGPVLTGRDEAEYRSMLAEAAARRDTEPDRLEQRWTEAGIPLGPPQRLAETIAALQAVGVRRWYLQWLDLSDTTRLPATWEAVSSANLMAD
jgi:alkanesulfonate monooxygenase SsuD/methylene tetrahydromethanopterin reductase-like flavin-dependent oxidoreductase (luciferase family)